MLFKRKKILEPYLFRLKIFDGVDNYNQLLGKYLKIEPHTVFNMANAVNFFKITTEMIWVNNYKFFIYFFY